MNENTPFVDLDPKDCKLVRLSGGRADGITTAVHKLAEFTDRPQGRYHRVHASALVHGTLYPVFELAGVAV
jgi:hypothetical protein